MRKIAAIIISGSVKIVAAVGVSAAVWWTLTAVSSVGWRFFPVAAAISIVTLLGFWENRDIFGINRRLRVHNDEDAANQASPSATLKADVR